MKLGTVPLLLLLARVAGAASVAHASNGRTGSALFAGTQFGRAKASPEDVTKCWGSSAKFIKGSVSPASAIEKAADYCAVEKLVGDKSYVCPHFKEAVTAAFADVDASEAITAKKFCEITEEYMLEMRGAARVPNIGAGPMTNFKLSETCQMAVAGAVAPKDKVPVEDVPDFWYAMCFNQDCAHFLPSRTRWCDVNRPPTHSYKVCEGVRKFAQDEAEVFKAKKDLTPDEVCSVYKEFVTETGIDIEAYEAVMQGDTVKRVPVPADAARALLASRQLNEAGSHYLRDHEGSPVEPLPHSGAIQASALFALALPFLARL